MYRLAWGDCEEGMGVPSSRSIYAKTGTFGIYGPRRSYAMEIINEIGKLDVIMFDENKFGDHDYTSEMAYNTDHLSALGAKQYTHRLDSLLATLEN